MEKEQQFLKLYKFILADKKLNFAEKIILSDIISFNQNNLQYNKKISTLEKEFNLSGQIILRVFKKLEKLNYIKREQIEHTNKKRTLLTKEYKIFIKEQLS